MTTNTTPRIVQNLLCLTKPLPCGAAFDETPSPGCVSGCGTPGHCQLPHTAEIACFCGWSDYKIKPAATSILSPFFPTVCPPQTPFEFRISLARALQQRAHSARPSHPATMDVGDVDFEIECINGHYASGSNPMYRVEWKPVYVETQHCDVYLQQVVDNKPLKGSVANMEWVVESQNWRISWHGSWVVAHNIRAPELIARFERYWSMRK